MTRVQVTTALLVVLAAGATEAQPSRPQPVCQPGFFRGAEGCAPMPTSDTPSDDAAVVFGTEDPSDQFSVLVEASSGPRRCEVSRSRPCVLRLGPQSLRVEVSGDASFQSTVTVPRGNTLLRIEARGRGLLIAGLALFGLGALGFGLSTVIQDGGVKVSVGLAGAVMVLAGIPMTLVDLFRSHSGISSVPLPGPVAPDPFSAFHPREPASGYAVTPIISLPPIRF